MTGRVAHNKSSTEEFIRKAILKHLDFNREFDYSKVDYKNARQKIEIGCKQCGEWFWQTPYVHLYPAGCANCRNISMARARSHDKSKFVSEALKVVGNKYSFDLVEYKNARTYVNIVCNDCGTKFKKKPTEILQGHGCRCHAEPSGYNSKEIGNMYIMACEDMVKIGITNLDPSVRAKAVSKSYGKDFQVLEFFSMDGQICTDLETELLEELRQQYESPTEKFSGYTETFYLMDIEKLRHRILELKETYERRKTSICTLQ